jgi:hypothetical protein
LRPVAVDTSPRTMTEIPDTPISATDPSPGPASPPAPAPVSVLRLPSGRATAVLAGAMLALGVAIGAAIGPAPDSSFAGASRLPLLLPSLAALAVAGAGGHSGTPAVQPAVQSPPVTPRAATSTAKGSSAAAPSSRAPSSAAPSPTSSSTQEASKPSPSTTPTSTGPSGPTHPLPAVTNVWLIELSGGTFAEALAQPAAAPYIDGQAVPAGTLLTGWSGLDGSAFASDATLLASTPPQLLDTIVQPPCPEGAAGAACTAGTPAGLTAADGFLQQAVPPITALAAYREHGLIVVTFGAVDSPTASGLPAGAATATLSAQPPAGVLLISPFASARARPSTPFNSASPKKSLEKLLHQ